MNDDKKSGLGGKVENTLTWAALMYLLAWVLDWLIQRRWGAFLILFIITGFGADLIVCGLINAIAWNIFYYYKLEPESWWWLHVLNFGFGAVIAAGTMANIDKPSRKKGRRGCL